MSRSLALVLATGPIAGGIPGLYVDPSGGTMQPATCLSYDPATDTCGITVTDSGGGIVPMSGVPLFDVTPDCVFPCELELGEANNATGATLECYLPSADWKLRKVGFRTAVESDGNHDLEDPSDAGGAETETDVPSATMPDTAFFIPLAEFTLSSDSA